jgi:hypothetical protein
MSSFVFAFKDIDKTKLNIVGVRVLTLENLPGLKEYMYRMAFVFLLSF